jgi:hypothetical protein
VVYSLRTRDNINFDFVVGRIDTVDFYDLQYHEVFWGNETKDSAMFELKLATRALEWKCRRNTLPWSRSYRRLLD